MTPAASERPAIDDFVVAGQITVGIVTGAG